MVNLLHAVCPGPDVCQHFSREDLMSITLLYFASVREALGCTSQSLPLHELHTQDTDGLWRWLHAQHPKLASWQSHLRLAVNEAFVEGNAPLKQGDTVALIPPVSGGQGKTLKDPSGYFSVTTERLDREAVESLVEHDGAGAVVLFTGRVRNATGERAVDYLVYEAYEAMALKKLKDTADEAIARWPDIRVAIAHRYGRLEVSDAAVVIAVSSPHRAQAYEASQYVIDRLKQVVPIWKKEVSPDGSEWIGMGP